MGSKVVGAVGSPVVRRGRTVRASRIGVAFACVALLAGCATDPGVQPLAGVRDSGLPSTAIAPRTTPDIHDLAAPVLARATAAAQAVHSYAFTSVTTTTIGGHTSVTRQSGRAVLPSSLAYGVEVNARHSDVVVIAPTTYRRRFGQKWHSWSATSSPATPLRSVLAVLRDLTPTALPGPNRVVGTLSTGQARVAGVLAQGMSSATVTVTLDLDAAGRPAHVVVTSQGLQTGKPVTVSLDLTLASFDNVRPISAPR